MINKRQMDNVLDFVFGSSSDENLKTFMNEKEIEIYKSIIDKYDIDEYHICLLREFILGDKKHFHCPVDKHTKLLSLKRNEKGEIQEW